MKSATQDKKSLLKFLIPSLLGILIFLVPFPLRGEMNTTIGHAKEFLMASIEGRQPFIVSAVVLMAAFLTLAAKFFSPRWIMEEHILLENLGGGPLWFAVRVCALPIALFVLLGARYYPEAGGALAVFAEKASFIVDNLASRLIILAVVLGIWAPLIMDFGLVQFIAVFASPVMRPLFRVPGRAAVDCVASWLGSSSMGVVFTAKMYDAGYYTDREAAAIVCGFSLAGIYNIYAIAELFDIEYAMPQILSVVYFTMALLAAVMPRVWPLSSIPDSYYRGRDNYHAHKVGRREHSTFGWALLRGTACARHMNARKYLRESSAIICALLLSTVPLMITFGTLFVVVAETTRIVSVLSVPAAAALEALGAAEADIIAAATVFSFVDHFLAAACGRLLLTEQACFICICLSITGLINLTEVGLHVWHSNIPLRFWQMTAVYVMRVFLSAIVVIPAAGVLFP
ncbi:YjiH family protein [Synergistes jonesii]|uniref:YjiH family protein n=1 Tax=Synergistes jonesii TaxID=2754 RepID=UPI00248E80C5|nr:nucleoside recognition domain-containing protein [Synergistes jonesii]